MRKASNRPLHNLATNALPVHSQYWDSFLAATKATVTSDGTGVYLLLACLLAELDGHLQLFHHLRGLDASLQQGDLRLACQRGIRGAGNVFRRFQVYIKNTAASEDTMGEGSYRKIWHENAACREVVASQGVHCSSSC